MFHSNPPLNRVIRLGEVSQLVGLSKSTLYRLLQAGKFPPSIKLSDSAVGWRIRDIELWLEQKKIESIPIHSINLDEYALP
jgi:prophage regulatory protein